jgi:hypothetical protein
MTHKRYAKVEGHPNLLRDLSTNAIINTDTIKSQQYIKTKQRREKEQEKIANIENELSELKSSMEEIKSMLRKIHES